ncbi:MAG: hypothetical protein QNJ04_05255 [Desulfobacterales bacterium]|nr:hypothetical protein [Desulfobacterales bacterium]
MRPLILTATGLFLAGCVSNPGVDTLNPAERESFKRIQILDNNVDQPHEVIARVKGKECHTTAEQSRRRTSGDAITVLKVKAARLGADAITNAQCDRHMTIDWRSDCWSSMLCVADAVKFQ